MENKEAVKRAKDYVAEIFADEHIQDVRLEAIRRGSKSTWDVTIGFARRLPVTSGRKAENQVKRLFGDNPTVSAYKRIKIRDSDGEVLEMSDPDWSQ
jgi:hypothetical protein